MQYVSLIIGFEVRVLIMLYRKIRRVPLMAHEREAKRFVLRHRSMRQSALPRKISKLIYIETVPQTDTGDQGE